MKVSILFFFLALCFPVQGQTYLDKLNSIEQKLDDIEFDRNIERMRRMGEQMERDFERSRQQRLQRNELPPINVPLPTTCDLYYVNNRFWYLGDHYDFIRTKSWVKVTFGKEPLIIYFQENFVDSDASNKNIRETVLSSSSEIRKLCPRLSKNIFK
jgi:hypothetical protein